MRGEIIMPGFTTHYIGGILTYKEFPICQLKESISSYKSVYQLGLQGPDIFLYNLLDLLPKTHPPLGTYMHTKHTGAFIHNCLKHIISASKKEQNLLLAYLSGFLCHYCLDSQCHPYIYSKSGYHHKTYEYTKNSINPRYYSHHLSLETIIDSLILERYPDCFPIDFPQKQKPILHPESIQIIAELLSSCIYKTYSIWASPRLIRHTIKSFIFENKCLSSLKNRRSRIQQLEEKCLGYPLLSSLIPSNNTDNTFDALNLNASIWHSPWQPSVSKNDTFLTLFHHGIKKCTDQLNILNSYLLSIRDGFIYSQDQCILYKKFIDMVGNLSYHSGLPLL